MSSMLKMLGLNPDELRANVDGFMQGMKAQADKIDANQARLEAQGQRIEARLEELAAKLEGEGSTREIYEDGKPTGVLITSERFPQALIDDVNNGGNHGGAGAGANGAGAG
jgi:hypothetical protein